MASAWLVSTVPFRLSVAGTAVTMGLAALLGLPLAGAGVLPVGLLAGRVTAAVVVLPVS